MRVLRNSCLVFSVALFATACFDNDKLTGTVQKLELIARKDYSPVRFTDGTHRFPKDTKFQIPARIEVLHGNAGNHKSYLFFKKQRDKKESSCEYRGGSSQGEPKGQKELDKAKFYHFVKCDNGMKVEDVATALDLRLRAENGGDSKASKYTQIKAVISYESAAAPTPTATPRVTPTTVPTATPTSVPTATPTPDIFAGLPPDPGEAGKVTLQGIDADNDGVRDDIQRLIQQTAPTSKPIRNALKQYAANAQKLFVAIGNDSEVARLVQESSNSSECAMHVMRSIEPRPDRLEVMNKLRASLVNTSARIRAEFETGKAVSGKVIEGIPVGQEAQACKFDINAR
jgi:hypothetical protein